MSSRLHPDDFEAIARRVAELLLEAGTPTAQLLTAAQVAERFGVSRDWVYEHADELGAVRLGDGPRGRLRFDVEKVTTALAAEPSTGAKRPPRQRRSTPAPQPASSVPLLRLRPEGA
jgi:hypothetical protein